MGYYDKKFDLNYFRPDEKVKNDLRADLLNKLSENNSRSLRDYMGIPEVGKVLRELYDTNRDQISVPEKPADDFFKVNYKSQSDYRREENPALEDYGFKSEARQASEHYYKNLATMNLTRELAESYEKDDTRKQEIFQKLFQAQKDLSFQMAQRETSYLQDQWNEKSILSRNVAITASLKAQDYFRQDAYGRNSIQGEKGDQAQALGQGGLQSKIDIALKVLPHLDKQMSHNSWVKNDHGFNLNGRWWENKNSPATMALAVQLNHHKTGPSPDPQTVNFGFRMDAFQPLMPEGFYKHMQDSMKNMEMSRKVGSTRLIEASEKNLTILGAIAKDYDHGRGLPATDQRSMGYLFSEQISRYEDVQKRNPGSTDVAGKLASFSLLAKGYAQSDPDLKIAIAKDDPYGSIVDPLLDRSLGKLDKNIGDQGKQGDMGEQERGSQDKLIYAPFSPKPPAWMMATMWDSYKARESLRGAMAEFSGNMNKFTYDQAGSGTPSAAILGGVGVAGSLVGAGAGQKSHLDMSDAGFKSFLKSQNQQIKFSSSVEAIMSGQSHSMERVTDRGKTDKTLGQMGGVSSQPEQDAPQATSQNKKDIQQADEVEQVNPALKMMTDNQLMTMQRQSMMVTMLHHHESFNADIVKDGLKRTGEVYNVKLEENALTSLKANTLQGQPLDDKQSQFIQQVSDIQKNKLDTLIPQGSEMKSDIKSAGVSLKSPDVSSPDAEDIGQGKPEKKVDRWLSSQGVSENKPDSKDHKMDNQIQI